MAKATCYIQVEPEFNWYGDRVSGVRAVRMTQKKPESPIGGTVLVKIVLDIDDQAFLPLVPTAEIIVPVDHTEIVAVESSPASVAV